MKNIGSKNRFERGVIGIILLLLGFYSGNWIIFSVLLFAGTIAMGEAFSGHCIYHSIRKTKDMR